MEKTINNIELHNYWNNKVIIREIKKYTDNRGMVGEIFRIDSDINYDAKMCYISDTNPIVLRGPHEHHLQRDVFISWGDEGRMIYQLYNPENKEMKYFITEPNKIYSVTVEAGIIHSYRNISSVPIKTLNFPDKLYKGYNKKEEIDEIRHEDIIKPSKNIWVLGANGRLGKSLVDKLFENMGYHSYNVIPICEKFENNKIGLDKLNIILNEISKNPNNIVINCIAKANVQDENADFNYENFLLPKFISEFCVKNKIYFIHFSTDYVYQSGIVSAYTRSKVNFETWLSTVLDDDDMWVYSLADIKEYIKVIRIANLFSLRENDTHNVLNKIFAKIIEGKITIPKNLTILPTSVEELSKYLVEKYIFNLKSYNNVIEVSGRAYNFYDFKVKFLKEFSLEVKENENPKNNNNTELFLSNKFYNEIDCDADIIVKLKKIKDSNGR